jgi:MYXO-CTERM domain-containing protein
LVEHLDIEPQATLIVTPQTRLFVKNSGIYRGLFGNASNQLAETFLAYYGTSPLFLESNFTGLLLAANARVVLGDGDSLTYRGRLLAKEIELRPDVTLTCSGTATQVFKPLLAELPPQPPAEVARLERDPDHGAPASTEPELESQAVAGEDVRMDGASCTVSPGRVGASSGVFALALSALLLGFARRRRSVN